MQANQQRIVILGTPIHSITMDAAKQRVSELIKTGGVVLTPNSEMLVTGITNPQYRRLFWEADLCVPDTTGLVFVSLGKIRHRIPGADLAEWILQKSEQENYSISVVIREGGFSTRREVETAILSNHPNLRVNVIATKGSVQEMHAIQTQLKSDIVLVGLGYPAQEHWIKAMREKANTPKLWMAIGGTADYWTKKKPRAPKAFRRFGIEWLWRVLIQPTRIFRILKAVIVFPWLAFVLKNRPLDKTS